MKTCACCKEFLAEENFSTDQSRKDGLFKYCKKCNSEQYKKNRDAKCEYQKEYRSKNKARYKAWSRKTHLKKKYNLTEDQYNNMLAQQTNSCAICKGLFTSILVPQIDHCHTTGRVRGLLCRPCNTAIGMLKDDVTILQNAQNYLTSY
jgi:hypothetical protein